MSAFTKEQEMAVAKAIMNEFIKKWYRPKNHGTIYFDHINGEMAWLPEARAALTAALGDAVVVPRAALMWLHGEGPDADGKWFGELEDEVIRTPRKYTPRYWWRSKFRSMIPNWSAVTRQDDKEGAA